MVVVDTGVETSSHELLSTGHMSWTIGPICGIKQRSSPPPEALATSAHTCGSEAPLHFLVVDVVQLSVAEVSDTVVVTVVSDVAVAVVVVVEIVLEDSVSVTVVALIDDTLMVVSVIVVAEVAVAEMVVAVLGVHELQRTGQIPIMSVERISFLQSVAAAVPQTRSSSGRPLQSRGGGRTQVLQRTGQAIRIDELFPHKIRLKEHTVGSGAPLQVTAAVVVAKKITAASVALTAAIISAAKARSMTFSRLSFPHTVTDNPNVVDCFDVAWCNRRTIPRQHPF
jgi:hypothetical protein